jgi:hypothetical protein
MNYGIYGSNPIAAEYAQGCAEGRQTAEDLIADQRARLLSEALLNFQLALDYAARPYSRAYALGCLRGYREVTR